RRYTWKGSRLSSTAAAATAGRSARARRGEAMARRGKGEGSIDERSDGRWRAYVTMPDGKRKYLYANTRKEIVRKLDKAKRDLGRMGTLPDERLTVEDFLKAWLDGITRAMRPQSMRRYRQAMEDHVIPVLGRRRLTQLIPEDLQRLYAAKLASGLSATTVRIVHFVLHRALRDAERWGRCSRNVADLVDPPRLPRKEAPLLTPEQARRVLDAARGHRLEVMFNVALRLGLRRGELLALRWRDVDLDAGTVRVTGTLQPVPQGADPIVAEPKSRSSRRGMSLDPSLAAMLRQHKRLQAVQQAAAGAEWFDGDFVFTNDLGRPVAPMTLVRDWHLLLESIGLPRVPFHTARHTAATLMLSSGVSPRVAAERLGHSTVSITLDRYSHVTESLRKDAAMAIDRALREAGYRPDSDRGSNRGSNPPERQPEPKDSSVKDPPDDAFGRATSTVQGPNGCSIRSDPDDRATSGPVGFRPGSG